MFVSPQSIYDFAFSPRVKQTQALLWTLTAVAILLSFGRFAIRYGTASKFYWDDASHLLSLVLLIALAGTYTAGFPYSARIARIGLKEEPAPPLTDPFYHTYLQLRSSRNAAGIHGVVDGESDILDLLPSSFRGVGDFCPYLVGCSRVHLCFLLGMHWQHLLNLRISERSL